VDLKMPLPVLMNDFTAANLHGATRAAHNTA